MKAAVISLVKLMSSLQCCSSLHEAWRGGMVVPGTHPDPFSLGPNTTSVPWPIRENTWSRICRKKYIYIKIVLCGKKLNCFRYANFQKETGVTANYSKFLLNLSASKNLRCLTHFIYLSGKKFENNIIVSMINEKAKYCWVVEDTGCYYGLLLLWIEPPRHQLTSHCYDYLLQYLFH